MRSNSTKLGWNVHRIRHSITHSHSTRTLLGPYRAKGILTANLSRDRKAATIPSKSMEQLLSDWSCLSQVPLYGPRICKTSTHYSRNRHGPESLTRHRTTLRGRSLCYPQICVGKHQASDLHYPGDLKAGFSRDSRWVEFETHGRALIANSYTDVKRLH